jgi:hypothetical protein
MIYYNSVILKKTDKIIFFDIDSTLTSSFERHFACNNENYLNFKKSQHKGWKSIKMVDFKELSYTAVGLFANLLKQTNAKAVCVSSWNINNFKSESNEEYLSELKEAFETISSEFPEDWLLGFSGAGGGDRHIYSVLPFIEETQFTGLYSAIDDGAFEYSDQSYTVQVNGRNALTYEDYIKVLEIFKMEKKLVNYT